MCRVGVSNESRCSSTMITQSNECKGVMKKGFSKPQCLHVVHLGCKMGVFELVFKGAQGTSKQQQAAAHGPKVLATTPSLKTGIRVTQNDRGANAHHHKQVSCRLEPSISFYGRFSVQKWPFLGCF